MKELPLDIEYQILEYLYDSTTAALADSEDDTRRAVAEALCQTTVHVQDIIAERPLTTSTAQRIEKLKAILEERRQ